MGSTKSGLGQGLLPNYVRKRTERWERFPEFPTRAQDALTGSSFAWKPWRQGPAATAQNMTSTIQTGKKSAKTAPVDGDEDEDSQGKLPDSQPVPRIKYIREVYDEDAKQQLPNDPPKDDGGESSEYNALDLIMKQIMPRQDEEVDSEAVDEAAKEEAIQQKQLKLKNEHEKKKAAQDVLEAVDMRRPLRLSAVGVVQPRSTRDKKFIKLARVNDFEIVYL